MEPQPLPNVFALSAEGLQANPLIFGESFEGTQLFLYSKPLESLGFAEGLVPLAEPAAFAQPLPEPDRVVRLHNDSAEPEPIDSSEWAKPWLSGLARPSLPCPEVRVVELPLGTSEDVWVTMAMPLPDRRSALIATEDGNFYRVSSSTVTLLPALGPAVPHGGGHKISPNEAYLAGCKGRALVPLELGTLAVEPYTPCDAGSWLGGIDAAVRVSGAPPETEPEVFVMSRFGELYHHVGTGPGELVYSLDRWIALELLGWVDPGEAMITDAQESFWWHHDDRTDELDVPWSLGPTPSATRAVRLREGPSLLAYSKDEGRSSIIVYDRPTERWHVMASSRLNAALYDAEITEDGFTFSGLLGVVGWHSFKTGFCAADPTQVPEGGTQPLSAYSFHWAVPINEREMFLSGWTGAGLDSTNRVWWVTRDL